MKPALIQFFEDYGRKKGTALFKKHLSEMEGIEGGFNLWQDYETLQRRKT